MALGIVTKKDYLESLLKEAKEAKEIKEAEKREKEIPSGSAIEPDELKEGEVVPELNTKIRNLNGRGMGNTEVPESIKKLIGGSVTEEGRAAGVAIADFLGISKSSVSAYANGAHSTASYNEPKKELTDFLANTRQRIMKRASGKLFKSLDVISEEKLEKLSALEASSVARNMAAVIRQMEPNHNPNQIQNIHNGPVITFYAPHIVKEDRFEVIQSRE